MATPTIVGTGTYDRTAPSATSKTVSHALASGTDMVLVFCDYNAGGGAISGVTYNGVAMTNLAAANVAASPYFARIYYLLAASLPAAGSSYNVVVSYPATTGSTNPVVCVVGVQGAKQNAPEAGAGLSIGGTDPVTSATITTVSASSLIVQALIGTTAATLSSWSNGQTTVNNQSARIVGTKTGPGTPGAQSMNADLSAAFTAGASLLVSIEGAATALTLAASGSELAAASGTPTYSGAFNAFRGLVLKWP